MKRTLTLVLLSLFALQLSAMPRKRAVRSAPPPPVLTFSFDFTGGSGQGWEAGFADYSPGMEVRTTGEIRLLPPEIGSGTAWYLSGWNVSDDLFSFLRRGLDRRDGIIPGQNYLITYTVTLATNAGPECGGVGGAPGESVSIKLGGASHRPEPVLIPASRSASGFDFIQMNIDKGNQSQGGVHGSTAGTVTSEEPIPCGGAVFAPLVRYHEHRYAIRSSPDGDLWLLFGTDSGFEGFNQIYVQKIDVGLTRVSASDPAVRWQKTYAEIFSLVDELERSGVLLREGGTGYSELIGGRELNFAIGEPGVLEEMYIYVFDTAAAAERTRGLISQDGSRIDGLEIEWIAPPHFFMGDHFIVNYVGSSPEILALLTTRLGPQFAGR
jgi:hypothetical protein